MTLDLGELDGSVTERVKKVAGILEKICPTEITTNLAGIRWAKLLINATLSGMSASLGCTFGDILDSDRALACAAFIGDETIQVAARLGVTLEKIQGADLRILAFKTKAEMTQKFGIYRAVFGPHKLLKASMLQDIEKGLKTEIGAINGVVSESGKKTGIATPINDKVVEIVKGIETGGMKAVFDNLSLFNLPDLPEK
jgi:2-dehydropantoate 2-reductase